MRSAKLGAEGFIKKVRTFFSNDLVVAAALFLAAAAIRAIPEVKAGVWPIGYDTFNTYVAELATYHGSLLNWLKTANLVYFFFLPFKLLGLKPDLIIKIFGPLFFGGLVASFYFWARNFVGFSKLKSFLASLLIVFQLATLRLSWDLYRNELGLIFLFWALVNLKNIKQRKNLILTIIFSILVGLSNELVTVVLLVILLFYLLGLVRQKKHKLFWRAAAPFGLLILCFLMVINSSKIVLYNPNVLFISESDYFVFRYFYQYAKDMSYQQIFNSIGAIFWLMYQFLFFFALWGFWLLRKNLILTTLTLWLLVGTFSALFLGGTGIIVWDRWLWMLAYPFAIYATEGVFQIGQFINLKLKKWHFHLKPMLLTLAVIFWLGFVGLFVWRAIPFLTTDYNEARPPLANDQLNTYFPRTMVHNSVGLWKIERTFDGVNWLNENVPSGAAVLVDNRYRGLMMAHFDFDNRYIITNNWSDQWSKKGLKFARDKGFTNIYLIWRTTSVKGFDRIFTSGNVAIYKAKPVLLDE